MFQELQSVVIVAGPHFAQIIRSLCAFPRRKVLFRCLEPLSGQMIAVTVAVRSLERLVDRDRLRLTGRAEFQCLGYRLKRMVDIEYNLATMAGHIDVR